MIADSYVRSVIDEKPNLLVAHYLIHSYIYYVLNHSIISDGLFDEICKRLDAEWDGIEHIHKHLVSREALAAGTGYNLGRLPDRIRSAAIALMERFDVMPPGMDRKIPLDVIVADDLQSSDDVPQGHGERAPQQVPNTPA